LAVYENSIARSTYKLTIGYRRAESENNEIIRFIEVILGYLYYVRSPIVELCPASLKIIPF